MIADIRPTPLTTAIIEDVPDNKAAIGARPRMIADREEIPDIVAAICPRPLPATLIALVPVRTVAITPRPRIFPERVDVPANDAAIGATVPPPPLFRNRSSRDILFHCYYEETSHYPHRAAGCLNNLQPLPLS